MQGKRILLIVGGGIAAYKACELIRLIRKAGGSVRCVLTAGGAQFVTPMTLAALVRAAGPHQPLGPQGRGRDGPYPAVSREADLVVVCPATADLLAKMAAGIADDLATTLLLATDKKVLAAPAMNVRMWQHEATQRNVARLRADGVTILEPDEGEMACGEYGPGRLPEPEAILAAIEAALGGPGPLAGKHVIVTAGPTHEPIDPVRDDRQPLVGQAGLRHRRGAGRAGRAGDPGRRPGQRWRRPPGVDRIDVETAARDGRGGRAPRCPPTPRCWSPRSPTGGSSRRRPSSRRRTAPPALDWQRTPDILADLATDRRAGRGCSSASPPRPTTSSRNAAAKRDAQGLPTGSSPTTSRAT